jgi:hypothetical protein
MHVGMDLHVLKKENLSWMLFSLSRTRNCETSFAIPEIHSQIAMPRISEHTCKYCTVDLNPGLIHSTGRYIVGGIF